MIKVSRDQMIRIKNCLNQVGLQDNYIDYDFSHDVKHEVSELLKVHDEKVNRISSDNIALEETYKQVWAIEQMIKHRLQVDFSRRTIECHGFIHIWVWDCNYDQNDFYLALQKTIKDIEKAYEN